jgi:cell division protein FtsZ
MKTQSTNVEFITIDAESNYENFICTFEGADIVFIAGGLGGQTGHAVAPEIARLAKHAGALTIIITTKSFIFERKKRHIIVQESLTRLKKVSDCVVIVPNDKIFSTIDRKLNNSEIFKIADSMIAHIIKGIIGTISASNENDAYLNIVDLQTIMSNREIAFALVSESQGEDAACEAITSAIEFTKNDNMTIQDASGVLVHCTMHPKFHFIKIAEAICIISEKANDSADVIFATTTDETLPIDFIRVILLITGFEKTSLVATKNSSFPHTELHNYEENSVLTKDS